jgi:hypothetical protein
MIVDILHAKHNPILSFRGRLEKMGIVAWDVGGGRCFVWHRTKGVTSHKRRVREMPGYGRCRSVQATVACTGNFLGVDTSQKVLSTSKLRERLWKCHGTGCVKIIVQYYYSKVVLRSIIFYCYVWFWIELIANKQFATVWAFRLGLLLDFLFLYYCSNWWYESTRFLIYRSSTL